MLNMKRKFTIWFFGMVVSIAAFADNKRKPNILFIAVDDLRLEINCYGAKHMHTPNLDRLAEKGLIIKRAYCQQAVCAPSRDSTGHALYERQDDWSSATFWYEPIPSDKLPEFPSLESRITDLWQAGSGLAMSMVGFRGVKEFLGDNK